MNEFAVVAKTGGVTVFRGFGPQSVCSTVGAALYRYLKEASPGYEVLVVSQRLDTAPPSTEGDPEDGSTRGPDGHRAQ